MKSLKITNLTDNQYDILLGLVKLVKLNPKQTFGRILFDLAQCRLISTWDDGVLAQYINDVFNKKEGATKFKVLSKTFSLINEPKFNIGESAIYLNEYSCQIISVSRAKISPPNQDKFYIYKTEEYGILIGDSKIYGIPADLLTKK